LKVLEEMDKFQHTYDHPKLNQEDTNHLKRSITHNEIEAAIKSLPPKKSQGPDTFSAEYYQAFIKELILTLLNIFLNLFHCLPHCMKLVLHSSQNWTRTHPKRRSTGQSS
jgi:hypothetical protein